MGRGQGMWSVPSPLNTAKDRLLGALAGGKGGRCVSQEAWLGASGGIHCVRVCVGDCVRVCERVNAWL